jgi:hypothetical protein
VPKALRRTDADLIPASHAQSKPAPAPSGALEGAAPTTSRPRELQERLAREFGSHPRADPEPWVERWSPATSMLIVLGGGLMLWTILAVGVRLALH